MAIIIFMLCVIIGITVWFGLVFTNNPSQRFLSSVGKMNVKVK